MELDEDIVLIEDTLISIPLFLPAKIKCYRMTIGSFVNKQMKHTDTRNRN